MSISIPDLNSASAVDSDDAIWSVVDGGDRQVTFSVLADFIRSRFGSLSEPVEPPNNDMNDADETFSLYRTDSGTANSPGSNRMVLHIALEDGSRAVQIAISAAATELLDAQFRELSGDGWSAWQEFWHTGNLEKQSDSMDDTSGRIALVGMGGLLGETESIVDWDAFNKTRPTNLKYHTSTSTSNNPWDNFAALLTFKRTDDRVGFLGVKTSSAPHAQIGYWDGTDTFVEDIWHTGNTTVDGSGFLLEASPIVRVYTDSISEPVKPVGATLTHSETGVYVLSGVPPLATEGWTVRTPEDVNGNKVVAIDPPEYDADAGTLTLRTYDLLWHEGRLVPGDPMDVPGDYFVMLRLHEEPADDEVAE